MTTERVFSSIYFILKCKWFMMGLEIFFKTRDGWGLTLICPANYIKY